MTQRYLVHFYTRFLQILGEVEPGPSGVYSHVNLPTSSHLEVYLAGILPLFNLSGKPVRRDKLWLIKESIAVIVLERLVEMGTSGLSRRGFTRPFPHWVRAEVGDYELSGLMQMGGNFEFGEVLCLSERNFIPLYKAKLASSLYPSLQVESPVMLFNRRLLQGMAQLTPREIPEGETEY